MLTRSVELTEELDRFISTSVESGRYENVSDVIRTALRGLERDTQEQEAKLGRLQTAIDQGDESGIAEPGVFDRVRQHLGLSGLQQ